MKSKLFPDELVHQGDTSFQIVSTSIAEASPDSGTSPVRPAGPARPYMRVHTASSGEAGLAVDLVTEVHFWDALMDDDISPEKSGHRGPITHHSTTLADWIPGVMKTPRTISSRTLETVADGDIDGRNRPTGWSDEEPLRSTAFYANMFKTSEPICAFLTHSNAVLSRTHPLTTFSSTVQHKLAPAGPWRKSTTEQTGFSLTRMKQNGTVLYLFFILQCLHWHRSDFSCYGF